MTCRTPAENLQKRKKEKRVRAQHVVISNAPLLVPPDSAIIRLIVMT